jgi:N6-adenosine-specific RNA methylase IME4
MWEGVGRVKRYGCILADPPWPLRGGKNGKSGWSKSVSPDVHYPLLSVDEISSLPVQTQLAAPNAHLWLWVPNCMLEQGLAVMHAWGFRYSNNVAWVKTGAPGLGQRIRTMHELCLLGLRGRTPYPRQVDGKRIQIYSTFVAPRGEHSAKPPEMRRMIERISPPERIELFARERVPGWDAFGNQVKDSVQILGWDYKTAAVV